MKKNATYVFGTEKRKDQGKANHNPGPNRYNVSKKGVGPTGTGPTYVMGLKLSNTSHIGTKVKQ